MASIPYAAPKTAAGFLLPTQIDLIRMSAVRQLKIRYRGSSFGVLWSLINPIFLTCMYSAIFGTAFSSYYGGSVTRYIQSAFVAVVLMTFFVQLTSEGLASVVSNGSLLGKLPLNPELFPIASIVANTFQQAITTVPLITVLSAITTHDALRVVLTPFAFLALVALGGGLALALSGIYVFFRDAAYIWGIVSFVFWMTSPVFYPAAIVPSTVRPFLAYNPLALIIGVMRDLVLGTGHINFLPFGQMWIVSLLVLVLGHLLFRAMQKEFIDLL